MLPTFGGVSPAVYERNAGVGCLLLPGMDGARTDIADLGERLIRAGFAAETPRIPWTEADRWPIWLDAARARYAALRAQTGGVLVVGCGTGCLLALLLAQQYPLDVLVCLRLPAYPGGYPGTARARSLRAMHRHARRDLYAIVAPTLIVQPTAEVRRAARLRDRLRAPCALLCADGDISGAAADAIIERARRIKSSISHKS